MSFAHAARATGACFAAREVIGGTTRPADGSVDVPINATPVVPSDLADVTLTSSGVDLAFHTSQFTIRSEPEAPLAFTRLLPDAAFPEGVEVDVKNGGAVVSSFTTGALRDDDAPPAPTIRAATAAESNTAAIGEWCDPAVDVRVTGNDDSAFFFAANDATPTIDGSVALSGGSAGQDLVVTGSALTSVHVRVVAVDLAGNVSAPAELAVKFPKQPVLTRAGCGGGTPALLMAPLAILRFRRRRQ